MLFYQFLNTVTILFLFIYFFKGSFEILGLIKSIKFINVKKDIKDAQEDDGLPFIYVLLPVLREQKIIRETINNFLNINYPASRYKIVVITTEKENYEKEKNKGKLRYIARKLSKGCKEENFVEEFLGIFTEDKLREIHNRLNAKEYDYIDEELKYEYDNFPTTLELLDLAKKDIDNDRFMVIHYPDVQGVMAHQLNYASEQLARDRNNLNNYICIYNADSEIDRNSFLEVSEIISKNRGKRYVIQQSAIFLRNHKKLKGGFSKFLVYAGGLFQFYWTFSTEIPRILKQSGTAKNRNVKLAHCVGHGLFIKLGLFKDLGFFPVETLNEDLAFGFKLSANRIPIYPLKCLEIADTPETLSSLINQKKVWFYSYLEYYKVRKLSLKANSERFLVNSLFVQGIFYGLMWLLNSFLLLVPIMFAILCKEYLYFYIVILFLVVYNFIPYFVLINIFCKKNISDNFNKNLSLKERTILSLFSILIYFTDSIGPVLSVKEKVISKVLGREIDKKKTER